MTAVRIEPQPESYESTITTRHLHPSVQTHLPATKQQYT